ncbi:Na(+)/H(+) antiporter subunit D [Saliphagus sp. LR7]|uniref:Na(+)/H(+) antiporter subunit D n=1 Tax=Saliphagus sp. LR7 TaxID=2282654 RepID=UPI000DF7846B|nr:Na(+)/H(+) antiporter subunit D [Saliphagus sp. LR7]
MDLFTIPPVLIVLAALAVLAIRPRLIHPAGLLAVGLAFAYAAVVPDGYELSATAFGQFEVLLVSVDPVSRLMGLIFGFIGVVAVLYSWSTDADPVQTGYALAYVASSLGAVFAGDWLTLVFCWELMALTSTLLVWHHGGVAVRAGLRYAILHGIGGSVLIAAVVWHYAEAGSFLITDAGIEGTVASVLAALGIGVNVAFVGLHAWLPDTYPRPHVAASVFLCVFTTKTGVYGLYRAFPDGHLWIAYMGGAMAVVGVTLALFQNDMRRLLSYHIQSQVGYMVAGVGIGTELAASGAFAHVFNHILYKALLFMTVGVVIYRTGAESLKRVHGMAREMPITFVAFTIAALSIAGFPGFNGFVSKGIIIAEAHHYAQYEPLWYMLLIGGVGTFMSFLKLGYYVFFYDDRTHDVERATLGQSVAMGSVAVLCVFYGLFPDQLFAILPNRAVVSEFHVFTVGHLQEGLGLALGGVIGFALVKNPLSRAPKLPDIDLAYNPVSIGLMRGLLRGVNDGIGVLDRGSSRAVLGGLRTVTTVSSTAGEGRRRPTERALSAVLTRRAGIGIGVFLVLLATTVALLVSL